MSYFRWLTLVASLVVAQACASDAGTGPREPVTSVVVEPATTALRVGEALQLRAAVRDRHDRLLPGRAVSWSSSDPVVATVSPTGRVTAHAVGTSTITATSERKQGAAKAVVTASAVPVARVTLDIRHARIDEGDQMRFTATPRDAHGNPLGGRLVEWASSDGSVASVTQEGVVTALRVASATIIASSEGKKATATVVVSAKAGYEMVHGGWPDYPFGNSRLFRSPAAGGPSRPVLSPDVLPNFRLSQPAVSPDGRRIAFIGSHSDNYDYYIFVVDVDGSNLQQLTSGGYEWKPTWSPDGKQIAYVVRPWFEQGDIWVMNADGSEPVNLTGALGDADQDAPAWSRERPGGSRIAFAEGDGSTYANLWTMRPDGSDRRRVTDEASYWDDHPSWSPDGSRIVFVRIGPETEWQDLWVMDATGANATSLVKLPSGQMNPDWSPDGRLIAFNSSHSEDPQDFAVIYTVWADGTNLVRRTYEPWVSGWPSWRGRP